MPSSVGPNTFGEENLVFGYDLGDVSNSYRGEPTTNILNNNILGTGNGAALFEDLTGTYIQLANLASSYSRFQLPSIPVSSNDTYTWSFELMSPETITTNYYFDANEYSDQFPASNDLSRVSAIARVPSTMPAGVWQEFSLTVTMKPDLTGAYTYDFFNMVYPTFQNKKIYYRNMQFEFKNHPTQYAGQGGTRSVTQGLIDLKGTSINLSTVSFDSSAQVIFDGSDDSLTCGTPVYSNRRDFTFVAWVKSDGTLSAARRGIFVGNNLPVGYISFFGHTGGIGTLLLETRDSTDNTYLGVGSQAFNIYSGEWVMVGFQIKQNALAVFYHNSTTFYYNETADSRPGDFTFQNFGIGSDSSGFRWDGYIDGVRFYDRILTQDELIANFKALKTRFI